MSGPGSDLPVLGDGAPGTEIPGDPALLAAGWQRRTMTDPSRANELVELYTSLGFEVKIQDLAKEDFGSGCETCAESACKSYVLLYTRRPRR